MIMSEDVVQWNKICKQIDECVCSKSVEYTGSPSVDTVDNEHDSDETDSNQFIRKIGNHKIRDLTTNNELVSSVQCGTDSKVFKFEINF